MHVECNTHDKTVMWYTVRPEKKLHFAITNKIIFRIF